MKRCACFALLVCLVGCTSSNRGQTAQDMVSDAFDGGSELDGGDQTAPNPDAADALPDGEPTLSVPADRPILSFTGTTATERNEKLKPPGFTKPDQTRCAADPSRAYIGEIVKHGISDVQVDYHWAPVVPGPNPERPTLDQPEWSMAGILNSAADSDDDLLGDHPFGLDFVFNVRLDAPFTFSSFPDSGEHVIHCEIEQGTFPRAAFGFVPQKGDRVLLRGVWVLDCGHPPYSAELHPPTFLAFARQADATTTLNLTFVAPYRSSLLFNPSVALAHALMIANRFEPIDYLVCAPLPRPPGAKLDASWRFAVRTGIEISVNADDESGCVRVRASMTGSYTPMPLPYKSADWSWEQLSASASEQFGSPIDVREEIGKVVEGLGLDPDTITALQADHPPLVDACDPLLPTTMRGWISQRRSGHKPTINRSRYTVVSAPRGSRRPHSCSCSSNRRRS